MRGAPAVRTINGRLGRGVRCTRCQRCAHCAQRAPGALAKARVGPLIRHLPLFHEPANEVQAGPGHLPPTGSRWSGMAAVSDLYELGPEILVLLLRVLAHRLLLEPRDCRP